MNLSESDSDIEFIANIPVRKPRKFRERSNYLNILDDDEFLRRFRISKRSFQLMLEFIRPEIEPQTAR
jgi:hypothetical protein